MKNIIKLICLLPLGLASTSYAASNFVEGSRGSATLHPSCREDNTGLTAIGVALPVGPDINVTVGSSKTSMVVSLPLPEHLISTDRKGTVFNANPIMSAAPSDNQSVMFGTGFMKGAVAKCGRKDKTEDTKTAFWKVKEINSYDVESNKLTTLPYIPTDAFVTVELGFAAPKFAPESCLKTMTIRGSQVARCDQVDADTKMLIAGAEPDIRTKGTRIIIERDLMKNPLPESCGEGLTIKVEPTDAEVDAIKEKMKMLTP